MQIELAAIVDYGEPFVKATYKLEGDGPLAFKCYETVECVSRSIELAYTPNVEAVANKFVSSSMKAPLVAFKAARLFSPSKVQSQQCK